MNKKYAWLLRHLSMVVGVVFSLLILLAVWYFKDKFQKPPQSKKVVQQITKIQSPPPLSPEIKQSEPEVKEEKTAEPEPEKEPEPAPEEADEPSVGDELALDADGAGGADSFNLAARKNGKPFLSGTGGSSILWYGGQIKNRLEDSLQNLLVDTPAMHAGYNVTIEVWVGEDGRISRSEMTSGSGKADVDQAIRNALSRLKADIGKPPPENMPQPIKIRLNSRV
jgi:TonB family protein